MPQWRVPRFGSGFARLGNGILSLIFEQLRNAIRAYPHPFLAAMLRSLGEMFTALNASWQLRSRREEFHSRRPRDRRSSPIEMP